MFDGPDSWRDTCPQFWGDVRSFAESAELGPKLGHFWPDIKVEFSDESKLGSVAARARDLYDRQARERQACGQGGVLLPVNLPEPMRTVCRELAEQINETAAPGDRVTEKALNERVRTREGLDIDAKSVNNRPSPHPHHPDPEPEPEEPEAPDYPVFDPALDIDHGH